MAERRRRRRAAEAPFVEARTGFESGTSLSLRRLERVYRNYARDLAHQVSTMRIDPATPRGQARMRQLIDAQARKMSSSLEQLVRAQVQAATRTATDAAAQQARSALSEVFNPAQVDKVFTRMADDVAKQRLEDGRVEAGARKAAEYWKQAALKAATYANVAHPPPVQMGRTMLAYLSPGNLPIKHQLKLDAGAPINPQYAGTRLVETELQTAYHAALVQAAQATPAYRGVDWHLSPRHAKYDVCDELVGFHPAGEEPDKPHPHCRCIIIPQYESASNLARRLRRWQDDRSSEPGIDSWYRQHQDLLGEPARAA